MRAAQRAAALKASLGQGILEQFLAASFRSHDDMMRLEKGLKRQGVVDHGVAGARETGEAVSEKRLLHSRWPRQIGKIANGEIDLPGFQRVLKVPGSHYRRVKIYPGRILRQPG